MKRFIICFFVVIAFASPAAATEKLVLDECLDLALTRYEAIQAAIAGKSATAAQKTSGFMQLLPQISASGTYMYNVYAPSLTNTSFNLPVIDTETQSISKYVVPLNLTSEFAPDYVGQISVSAAQPLTMLWSAAKAYDILKIRDAVSDLQVKLTRDETAAAVTEYYYAYFMLTHMVEVFKETEVQLQQYARDAQALIDAGVTDKRNLLKINTQMLSVQSDIAEMQGQIRVAKAAIGMFINMSSDAFDLDEERAKIRFISLSSDQLVELQQTTRYQIRMLRDSLAIQDKLVDIAYQPFMPTVTLAVSYQRDFEQEIGAFSFGGVASYDFLTNWISDYYSLKQAKAERVKAKLEMVTSVKQMNLQVTRLSEDIKTQKNEVEITSSQIVEAAENLRIEEAKFAESISTNTDLLLANTALRQAKAAKISAEYRYLNAVSKLAYTMNVDIKEISSGE